MNQTNNIDTEKLLTLGWVKSNSGRTKHVDYNESYAFFIRKSNAAHSPKTQSNSNFETMFNNSNIKNIDNISQNSQGADRNMGSINNVLPLAPSLNQVPSLASLVSIEPCLCIGLKVMWRENCFTSPSVACCCYVDSVKYDFIFLCSSAEIPSIDYVLGRLMDELYSRHPDAMPRSVYRYGNAAKDDLQYFPVTVVCHDTLANLCCFQQFGRFNSSIIKHLTSVGKGAVSMFPIRISPISYIRPSGWFYNYHLSISIRDTICCCPSDACSIADMGKIVGIAYNTERPHLSGDESVGIPDIIEKGCNGALIPLLYSQSIFGINLNQPPTILTATARCVKKSIMEYLCVDDKHYNKAYRGLNTVKHGLQRTENGGFNALASLDAVNDKANTIQHYASEAYHGGYNSCSEVGFFPYPTNDFDIQNAYPSAMCLVPDVDWDDCIIERIENRYLTIQDFLLKGCVYDTFPLLFCYIRFEFPFDVKYPYIPAKEDGVPDFPRTSDGLNGVYACGPELFLAVKLGAKVWVETGYRVRTKIRENGEESYSLRYAVKQLVSDRIRAKKEYGKGSLPELVLKLMVNGSYGKIAQNVIKKSAWNVYKNQMDDIGISCITNPVSAAQITSIVRAILLATQNQLHNQGYHCVSVTTDGFISDAPYDVVNALDLYGMAAYLFQVRLFLTDGASPDLWEIKHKQDDLLNFTTRGNVSLNTGENVIFDRPGVCAHNGVKSGFPSDSYEDRLWLMTQVLSRTGAVEFVSTERTSLKEIAKAIAENRKDDAVIKEKTIVKHVKMDYDLKRKPIKESFKTDYVSLDGEAYEIAHFDTEPFESIEEFKKYRQTKKDTKVLRTQKDWDLFYAKLSGKGSHAKITDIDWAKLTSCIKYYRAGTVDIPVLTKHLADKSWKVADVCAWIQSHNRSKDKVFSENTWKDCRKPERLSTALPMEEIVSLLQELQAD